ncbi:hypothetical protein FCM35_KLT11167 [Carex littledalei]|uniref:Uncharacterized protein n=1 Tax=Carex littledalei TaxID=544730 RepID=A0A833QHP4_9POAL|nr:hypothetical protein FCM35_KLT11167 [Carex littledalei]
MSPTDLQNVVSHADYATLAACWHSMWSVGTDGHEVSDVLFCSILVECGSYRVTAEACCVWDPLVWATAGKRAFS